MNAFAVFALGSLALAGCAPAAEPGPESAASIRRDARLRLRFVDTEEGAPVACRWVLRGPPQTAGAQGERVEGIGTACEATLAQGEWTLEVDPLDPARSPQRIVLDLGGGESLFEEIAFDAESAGAGANPQAGL